MLVEPRQRGYNANIRVCERRRRQFRHSLTEHPMIDQAVLVEDDSFCLIKGTKVIATVSWSSIAEIILIKSESGKRTSLSFEFRLAPGDHYVEVSEEMLGFEDLVKTLVKALPGFDRVWTRRGSLFGDSRSVHIYGERAKAA